MQICTVQWPWPAAYFKACITVVKFVTSIQTGEYGTGNDLFNEALNTFYLRYMASENGTIIQSSLIIFLAIYLSCFLSFSLFMSFSLFISLFIFLFLFFLSFFLFLFIFFSFCLSLFIFLFLSLFLSSFYVSLFTFLSFYLSFFLSFSLFIFIFLSFSHYLSLSLIFLSFSFYLSLSLFISFSFCLLFLFIFLSFYLSLFSLSTAEWRPRVPGEGQVWHGRRTRVLPTRRNPQLHDPQDDLDNHVTLWPRVTLQTAVTLGRAANGLDLFVMLANKFSCWKWPWSYYIIAERLVDF